MVTSLPTDQEVLGLIIGSVGFSRLFHGMYGLGVCVWQCALFMFCSVMFYLRMRFLHSGDHRLTPTVNCPSQETEVTSTRTRPVDNVVIATKGLQDRNICIIAGTTVENKGKLILTEIFPSLQKHDI